MQTRSKLVWTMARASFEHTRQHVLVECGYDSGPWEDQGPDLERLCVAKMSAALAAAEAAGAVMVPEDASLGILEAMSRCEREAPMTRDEAWHAMLAASPFRSEG